MGHHPWVSEVGVSAAVKDETSMITFRMSIDKEKIDVIGMSGGVDGVGHYAIAIVAVGGIVGRLGDQPARAGCLDLIAFPIQVGIDFRLVGVASIAGKTVCVHSVVIGILGGLRHVMGGALQYFSISLVADRPAALGVPRRKVRAVFQTVEPDSASQRHAVVGRRYRAGRVNGRGEHVLAVVRILEKTKSNLPEVVHAGDVPCFSARLRQCGQQHGRQYGDDGYDNQQFN